MTYDPARTGLIYTNVTMKPGDTVANTGVETNFASNVTLPANTMVVGKTYRIEFMGKYTTPILLPPSTIAKVKLGNVAIVTTPELANIVGATDLAYQGTVLITVISTGVTGSVRAGGQVNFSTALLDTRTVVVPQMLTVIDTTVDQVLQLATKFGGTGAGNSNSLTSIHIYESRPPKASN